MCLAVPRVLVNHFNDTGTLRYPALLLQPLSRGAEHERNDNDSG
jgi:hypothetical protein